jgi:allophanate hydrolase
LFALDTVPPKPGLIRVGSGGVAIEAEVWDLPAAGFGTFVAGIPSPLGIGKIHLANGALVSGFLCEETALAEAKDVSATGGWRSYLKQQ